MKARPSATKWNTTASLGSTAPPMGLPHACASIPSRQRERLLTNRPMRARLYVSKFETNCNVILPYAYGLSSKRLLQ